MEIVRKQWKLNRLFDICDVVVNSLHRHHLCLAVSTLPVHLENSTQMGAAEPWIFRTQADVPAGFAWFSVSVSRKA